MYPVGGLALSLKQSGANGATGSLFFCFLTGLQNILKKLSQVVSMFDILQI